MTELFDKQQQANDKLRRALEEYNCVLNASSTGTGKSLMCLFLAKSLGLTPLVVAPLAAHSTWRRWSEELNIPVLGIVNVERLRTGKTEWVSMTGKGKQKSYTWNLDRARHMVILDEAHKGITGAKTETGKMVSMLRPFGIKTVLATATPPANPLNLRNIGYLLGQHSFNTSDFYNWCRRHGCTPNRFGPPGTLEFKYDSPNAKRHLERINQAIADRMVKLTIDDLSEYFEGNMVEPILVDLSQRDTEEIQQIYSELSEEIKRKEHANPLVATLRSRQRVEALKSPVLAEMIADSLEEGYSVFVAVSFRDTIQRIKECLTKDHGVEGIVEVHGDQSAEERNTMVQLFQSDLCTVLIATAGSGGISVSLHNTEDHQRPRTSIITPSNSVSEFIQVLGRIHRAGGKTAVLQRIVCAAGTVESKIAKRLEQKIHALNTLTDSDLSVLDD